MNMVVRSSRPRAARAVLCGSYRRDIDGLRRAYDELAVTGCQVLSPRRVDFMDGEFVVDAAEVGLSPREIENWHLRAIEQSDFILLHAPKGYVGISAAMEIGYALALKKPIFSRTAPVDIMLRELVYVVPSVYDALCILGFRS